MKGVRVERTVIGTVLPVLGLSFQHCRKVGDDVICVRIEYVTSPCAVHTNESLFTTVTLHRCQFVHVVESVLMNERAIIKPVGFQWEAEHEMSITQASVSDLPIESVSVNQNLNWIRLTVTTVGEDQMETGDPVESRNPSEKLNVIPTYARSRLFKLWRRQ
ncbi:unnamed protein product [Peronospora effusa]|uniref:Uncharacterized protein n=1 Tax=Peronospora effusa TaxID=542832 RepID=A0A3R7XGA0_9STRA|nr:hypothetical protein DD237_006832 [Peronospora effusa]CAI5702033.1 unnamed protein product [Peronospora effusa]